VNEATPLLFVLPLAVPEISPLHLPLHGLRRVEPVPHDLEVEVGEEEIGRTSPKTTESGP